MLSEKIIRAFSLSKHEVTKEPPSDISKPARIDGKELSLLKHEYLNFEKIIEHKTILDFGCGYGFQSIALAKAGASYVVGLDINSNYIESAKSIKKSYDPQNRLNVSFSIDGETVEEGQFDLVISQNSMEHFTDPVKAMGRMKSLIKPSGKILITFGPPWFSPYGSHMHFFCRLPWLNIFFSEKAVMAARSLYREDGATRYTEVESGLNKMTLIKFERLVEQAGLKYSFRRYKCVKDFNKLSKVPCIRELFVNRVTVVLEKQKN